MFGHTHYVPILRWKRAEQKALRELFPADKHAITPLVEVPGGDHNPRELAEQIAKTWGHDHMFLDVRHLATRVPYAGDTHPVTGLFNIARMLGLKVIPVTGLLCDRTYQAAISADSITGNLGACIRLFKSDLVRSSLAADLEGLVSALRLQAASVDLVVDLQIFGSSRHDLAALCAALPKVTKWRTLTVASGSFPKDLTGLTVGQHLLPRLEWQSWKRQLSTVLPRRPTYGDYAMLHPYLSPWFPGMNVSASVRYTIDEHWLIMRGEGLLNKKGAGHAQYPANAELLCHRTEYRGPQFSYGDKYIYEIALKKERPGNPETWLRAGVNHHLTFVVRQITNMFGL